jgi:ATP-binding cassette subfamily B protein
VLVGFITAMSNFFDPITQLSQLYTTYQSGMAALDKIFELLDEEPDMKIDPNATELEKIRGEVVFEDVDFEYATGPVGRSGTSAAERAEEEGAGTPSLGRAALSGINLQIAPGQTVALVGSTGAGKSTLAKLVARFYDPTSGRVLIDGHDLAKVTTRSVRSQMGIVPQEGYLFAGTVRDNIAFGRPEATDDEVHSAAEAVGAGEFIAELAHGYDTQVGERGAQLSAGQRQLLAFARALIADPRILILDEATSNVDLYTEGRIEAALRRLLAGRTSIVIAHRLSTIRQAAKIVVLDGGRIVESGTHDELLDAHGAYWDLYRDWSEQAAVAGQSKRSA